MRWGLLYLLLSAALLLLGCGGEEGPYAPPTSLLTFRYDAARDVVLAATHALRTDEPVTAQRYAEALARRPESGYAPSLTLRLASPEVAVQDDVLTVNYREAAGLGSLASAQVEAVMAALEGWRWVPGVREVRVQALGQPLTALGPLALAQPLAPAYHTYVVQPVTGEVGYLTGGAQPRTLAEAVTLLQRRTIRDTPALQGFRPLLPVGITLTVAADRLENGVQPVELSVNYPRTEVARLAGLVLNLAQFPPWMRCA